MPKRLSVRQIDGIRKHRYILKTIASVDGKTRKNILRKAPNQLFTVIRNVLQYVLNDLPPHQKHKVKKLIRKRPIKGDMIQHGGMLGNILATAIPLLISLL